MASSAAGRPGRGNEDFVGAVPTAAVLVDGAGGVDGADLACRHGTAWYAHRLGAELLALLAHPSHRTLPALLAEAIERVTDAHRPTCDVADPRSPWAAVAILRASATTADYLVLGDAFVVLDRPGAARVVTDGRELAFARPYEVALEAAAEGSPEHERLLREARDAMRANRNRPGAFWAAKDDPGAAAEAVTGTVAELTAAALLSNGVTRLVDGPDVLALLATDGPESIIRRVRQAEALQGVPADDASIAHCTDLTH